MSILTDVVRIEHPTSLDVVSGPQLLRIDANGVGIGGTASAFCDLDITTNGALQLPVGTTSQRPTTPVDGMIRFNTTLGEFEIYEGTDGWITLSRSLVSSKNWIPIYTGSSIFGNTFTVTGLSGYVDIVFSYSEGNPTTSRFPYYFELSFHTTAGEHTGGYFSSEIGSDETSGVNRSFQVNQTRVRIPSPQINRTSPTEAPGYMWFRIFNTPLLKPGSMPFAIGSYYGYQTNNTADDLITSTWIFGSTTLFSAVDGFTWNCGFDLFASYSEWIVMGRTI